jgi:hypothetical protein
MPDIDLNTMSAAQGTRIAMQDFLRFGQGISAAGDINNDGIADLILLGYDAVRILYGQAGGFGATLDLATLGPTQQTFVLPYALDGARFGFSVDAGGDVNGDGIDDIVIGVPSEITTFGADPGRVLVIYGRDGGLGATLDTNALTAEQGFVVEGLSTAREAPFGSRRFGFDVAMLGDVDGDGLGDIAALTQRGGAPRPLYAAVVYGDADRDDGTVRLDGVPADQGLTWANNGNSLAGVGDVNGDGRDDVLLATDGVAVLLFGQDGAWGPVDYGTLTPDRGIRILTSNPGVTGSIGHVARAGDLNGDGIADMLITQTPPLSGTGFWVGHGETPVHIVYGRAEGFSADIDLATLSAGQGTRIIHSGAAELTGASMASAGDMNGDGIDDIVVITDSGFTANGMAAYVVYGQLGGLPALIDLANLDEEQGFRISHSLLDLERSTHVIQPFPAGVGDVNGDGADDLLLDIFETWSAPFLVYGQVEALDWAGTNGADGKSGTNLDDVVSGRGGNDWMRGRGGEDTLLGGAGGDTLEGGDHDDLVDGGRDGDLLKGGAGQDMLVGGDGADTLDGGTGADVLIGGAGFDVFIIDDAGDVIIDDPSSSGLVESAVTWRLTGSHVFLNLTGTAAINGFGSAAGDAMKGNDAANRLAGRDGRDSLTGGGGNDRLLGERGDDTLAGQAGSDALLGGDGADSLDGGAGFDWMTGGLGADSFRFSAAPISAAADRIYDFSAAEGDRIVISLAAFDPAGATGLVAGSLSGQAGRFQASLTGTAATAEARFIYESDAGRLYFDADGRGGEASVLVARLSGAPTVLAGDIWLE